MFFKKVVLSAFILSIPANVAQGKPKLPSFIKVCRRSDPHLNECIKNSVEHLRSLLAKGIPEFDIPSCEPLYISEVVIDQGSGPVAVRSTYTDIRVFGPSDFVLRYIRIDMDRSRIRIKLWFPHLHLLSRYTMDGRILMMPISGSGISRGNYSNIDAAVSMQGQRIKKDDETYFNIKDFNVDFNIGQASIQLDDLFNGDKELASWLKVCRKSDPELNKCLHELFSEMFPELAKGIPEMNVDPFEPLLLDKVSVSKGSGAITLSGGLFDLVVSGPSNSTPTYTEFDLKNQKWNFGLDLPQLNIKSQYNLKGKILVLPLVGHGACDLRLTKVQTKIATDISFPVVEGREVVKIENMHVSFNVGGMKVKLQNLFNGNKVLGQTVNQFVNQNALEIIGELQDSIGASLAGIFTDIMNNVYTKMPTDLWLLNNEQWEKYKKERKE